MFPSAATTGFRGMAARDMACPIGRVPPRPAPPARRFRRAEEFRRAKGSGGPEERKADDAYEARSSSASAATNASTSASVVSKAHIHRTSTMPPPIWSSQL